MMGYIPIQEIIIKNLMNEHVEKNDNIFLLPPVEYLHTDMKSTTNEPPHMDTKITTNENPQIDMPKSRN